MAGSHATRRTCSPTHATYGTFALCGPSPGPGFGAAEAPAESEPIASTAAPAADRSPAVIFLLLRNRMFMRASSLRRNLDAPIELTHVTTRRQGGCRGAKR